MLMATVEIPLSFNSCAVSLLSSQPFVMMFTATPDEERRSTSIGTSLLVSGSPPESVIHFSPNSAI